MFFARLLHTNVNAGRNFCSCFVADQPILLESDTVKRNSMKLR